MSFPLIVLGAVIALILLRRIGRLPVRIWHAVTAGALAVLLGGAISPRAALAAIDPDVMLFLFGVFVLGRALEASGYLGHLAYQAFAGARSTDALMLRIMAGAAGCSALLMNDTLAVIGTPLVLLLARTHRLPAEPLLFGLAYAVTIGSVASPIGNPQNLLIAVHAALPNPFVTFLAGLALPTAINLLLAYAVLRIAYRSAFHRTPLEHAQSPILDPVLARAARNGLVLLIVMVVMRVVSSFALPGLDVPLSALALAAALPVLLAPGATGVVRRIDWPTLVFFAALFVLTESVWQTGALQRLLERTALPLAAPPVIYVSSVLASQLISNVPFVALYLPVLLHAGAGVDGLLALAAGSTIAGNLFVLGAASNVIIVHAAERAGEHFSLLRFTLVGAPLTALNLSVYALFS